MNYELDMSKADVKQNKDLLQAATAEDKQRAYESAVDHLTNVFLLQDMRDKQRSDREKQAEDAKEAKRLQDAKARAEYAAGLKLNAPMGRVEFFVNYMQGGLVPFKGYNEFGNAIQGYAIGHDLNGAGNKIKESLGLMTDFSAYGEFSHYVFRYTNIDVINKLITKFKFPETALTVAFANGSQGMVYKINPYQARWAEDLLASEITISRKMVFMADDKLTFDVSKLDSDGFIKAAPRDFVADLQVSFPYPVDIREKIIGLK